MEKGKTALLVIDVQESFRHRACWNEAELPPFIRHLHDLIDQSKRLGIPVLQVFHADEDEGPNGPFSRESGHVRTLAELALRPEAVFHKSVHSALYARNEAGETLEEWLRSNGCTRLVITGIRTEQCCETTARHAFDAGFDVRYVTAATLTFAMTSAAGRTYSPEELRDRTELVLAGRFATIVRPEVALA